MLGPIVVRHVAHMLEDLNDSDNRPCKSCNMNVSNNNNSILNNITASTSTSTNSTNNSLNSNNKNNLKQQQQQQQRRPRSLLSSSMSSSLSPASSSASNHMKDNNNNNSIDHNNNNNNTHEHGHSHVHAYQDRDHHVTVNGAGYRHLAYQAVRLNKILPESVSSARPNSLYSYQRQIIRKLSITTPSPCPSRPQSPEQPSSSYNHHHLGEHEEEGHTTGLNNNTGVDVMIDNARPVDIDQIVAQFPVCEQQNRQQTVASNRPHSRPPRTRLRPQSLQAVRQQNPNCWDSVRNRNSSSGRYARCVVMDFRPRAQKQNNHVAQQQQQKQQSSSQSPSLPSPRIQQVAPPAYIGPCRDTTNRPLSPTVGPRLQQDQGVKSCLLKSSTKSSTASTQADIEDEYDLDGVDDNDVVDYSNNNNNNRNARDNIENTNVNLCSQQPLPSGVSTRWRTQHGKPDPSSSLPRAGIDATLLSHSARKLKRSATHCRHDSDGGDDEEDDEDPPSSHDTSIDREHGSAAGKVSETVDAHGSWRRTNMDGVHSRLILLRRQRERRRSPLR